MDRVAAIRRMIEHGEQADLFAPNVVNIKPWDLAAEHEATSKGPKGKVKFDPKTRFSDLKVTVEDVIEQGDKVVVRWRLHGKWTGSFAGVKATGNAVDIAGVNFYTFANDKIVHQDGMFDAPTFMRQARGSLRAEECERAMVRISRPPDFRAPVTAGPQ